MGLAWTRLVLYLLGVCGVHHAYGQLCGQRLGMEDGSIHNSRIRASSVFHEREGAPHNCEARNARLNNPGSGRNVGGWCPARDDKETPWFLVDLMERLQVEGVIMQGSIDPYGSWVERVTAYQVQYSDDDSNWLNVTDGSSETATQTFPGNIDLTTPVTSLFDRPIQARYVRIRPTAYYNWPSMRVELIGCKARLVQLATTIEPVSCGGNGVPYENECFYIFADSSKWIDADVACQRNNGARLVTITDQDINDFLAHHIEQDVWIGLHDTHEEGSWRWVDDTLVNYTNFQPLGSPRADADTGVPAVTPEDTNCVMLHRGTGRWREERCTARKGRICALPRGESLCPDGGTFFRDRCYWYGGVNSWNSANTHCEEQYGDGVKLVIIRDAELNAFLSRHVHPGIWLGLHFSDGTWRWVDGSQLDENSYEKWRDGESGDMEGDRNYAFLEYDGGYWTRQDKSPWNRFVCALQTCYDGPDGGSGAGKGDTTVEEESNCLDFGSSIGECMCVTNALCRRNGKCHCDKLFHGMKCNKDELTVTIYAPNRLTLESNVTMRCEVNLPSTDVAVLWQKVSGTKTFPEDRTSMPNRPELGEYDLVIERIQEDDAGSYVCAATTILGEISEVRMDSTYLHLEVANLVKPAIDEVSNPDGGKSSTETGLFIAVAALSVCLVCLLVAFLVVKVRLSIVQKRARRPSDMLM